MFKTIKNQKGMTLVELLAVMVIVGIIAAISIPAIGNLMENTRKDAHISNMVNLQESARLYLNSNEADISAAGETPVTFTLTPGTPDAWEVTAGAEATEITDDFTQYIDNLVDPHTKGSYISAIVVAEKDENGQYTFTVEFEGEKYEVVTADAIDARQLTRALLDVK